MRGSSNIFRLLPMLAAMVAIFISSHLPGNVLGPTPDGLDKILHLLVYGVLAIACLVARPLTPGSTNRRFGLGVVLFCLLYGLSDEFHQSFVPGRFVSGWDVAADLAGALLVVGFWLKRKKEDTVPGGRS